MKAKFSIVSVIVEKAAIFGKKSMSCVIAPLVDKFADIKVKGQCLDTLMLIAERMTLNYTSLQVINMLEGSYAHVHVTYCISDPSLRVLTEVTCRY